MFTLKEGRRGGIYFLNETSETLLENYENKFFEKLRSFNINNKLFLYNKIKTNYIIEPFIGTRLAAASDKVYQLLAHGRWFSPGTPASSTTKIGRHDIAEILLKVALKHQKSINQL
jgi:hypothetical protein